MAAAMPPMKRRREKDWLKVVISSSGFCFIVAGAGRISTQKFRLWPYQTRLIHKPGGCRSVRSGAVFMENRTGGRGRNDASFARHNTLLFQFRLQALHHALEFAVAHNFGIE